MVNKIIIFSLLFLVISVIIIIKVLNTPSPISDIQHYTRKGHPFNDGKSLGYNEINLIAPYSVCKLQTKDLRVLPIPIVKIDSNDPIPHFKELKDDFLVHLELTNQGVINYTVNGVVLWNSLQPKQLANSKELNILKHYSSLSNVETWPVIYEKNNLKLHLKPFAISYNNRILWSLFSGYDATIFCIKNECEIDYLNNEGTVILISNSREYRMALLSNGDIIVLKSGPEKPRGSIHTTTFKSSLLRDTCLNIN